MKCKLMFNNGTSQGGVFAMATFFPLDTVRSRLQCEFIKKLRLRPNSDNQIKKLLHKELRSSTSQRCILAGMYFAESINLKTID